MDTHPVSCSLYATVWPFPRRRRLRFSASSIILATIARSASLKAASSVAPVTTAPMAGTVAINWSPVWRISILCVVLTAASFHRYNAILHHLTAIVIAHSRTGAYELQIGNQPNGNRHVGAGSPRPPPIYRPLLAVSLSRFI